ncbi:MAG: sensor histidine kinase [Alphaproteobacteria bacterium]
MGDNRRMTSAEGRIWLAWAFAVGIFVAAAWYAFAATERFFSVRIAQQNESTLRLAAAGLRGALMRYEPLPGLLADKADIKALFEGPSGDGLVAAVNVQLKQIARDVGASDVYVMDRDGDTVAASNFDQQRSFVGRNFSFRPYFQRAVEGGDGRYFALGTTSLLRGYYYAAPIRVGGGIAGVIVVKVSIDDLESDWRGSENELIVSDESGVIFMSSRPEWLFSSLRPLTPAALQVITDSQRYPLDRLALLDATFEDLGLADGRRISIATDTGPATFIMKDMAMPEAGWTISILSPNATAAVQASSLLAAAVLAILLAALGSVFLYQRRVRLFERLSAQQEAQALLERRVFERTADLNEANTQLVQEVKERTAAELNLRKTQSELIQAGKLAALGQMSAALSHEMNQPLAAVKSYADNARAFLDRERIGEARENISRISDLADRMAGISNHLRNFARKPREKLGAVPVATVVNDALQIMAARIRASQAVIDIALPTDELWVVGGQIRLQQVLVNLISNALDATKLTDASPKITIAARRTGPKVVIVVRDNGPGLQDDQIDLIFDPFFTTKGVGEGLGLGLSVSYNIVRDFGGALSAANHADGGAVFSVELAAAARVSGAAE